MPRSAAFISCAQCGCEQSFDEAWDRQARAMADPVAARILEQGHGLARGSACHGCPCHTGDGDHPALLLHVQGSS
jgi:hypothetical protein